MRFADCRILLLTNVPAMLFDGQRRAEIKELIFSAAGVRKIKLQENFKRIPIYSSHSTAAFSERCLYRFKTIGAVFVPLRLYHRCFPLVAK